MTTITIQTQPAPQCAEHQVSLPCGIIGCRNNPCSSNFKPEITSETLRAYLVSRYGEKRVVEALKETEGILLRPTVKA